MNHSLHSKHAVTSNYLKDGGNITSVQINMFIASFINPNIICFIQEIHYFCVRHINEFSANGHMNNV